MSVRWPPDTFPAHFLPEAGLPAERRVLVLLNPFSGQGKSLQRWEQDCKAIFDEIGLHCTVVHTGEWPGPGGTLLLQKGPSMRPGSPSRCAWACTRRWCCSAAMGP